MFIAGLLGSHYILQMSCPRFDLFGPEFKRDPFTTFARMRQEAPVYAQVSPNGTTTWYITRYDDVLAVLHDNDHFVKDMHQAQAGPRPLANKQPSLQQQINQNMLFSDPPDHTRLRALVNQAFTPRRIQQMAPRVQQIAHQLLDEVAPHGQMDLIQAYAMPLPVAVICELLGIPAEDRQRLADYAQSIIAPTGKRLGARLRKQKMQALVRYLQQLFGQRRQQPQDDLITALVQAETVQDHDAQRDRLSEAELSSMVALLLVTGHETTVNLIGNGVLTLLQHPAQLAVLQAEPEGWPTAVEELLRYDGTVETSTTRWVRADFLFRGQQLRQGDVVRVSLASANRDDACVLQPNELQLQRRPNRHLAFGHGIHYCLGAPLARLEGQIAFQTLFERWPQIELACAVDALRWRPGVLFRGVEQLPLRW